MDLQELTPEDFVNQQPEEDPRRCSLCPRPTDYHNIPQVPLETAVYTYLQCGCRFHTNCLSMAYTLNLIDNVRACHLCHTDILTDEQTEWLRNYHREGRDLNRINYGNKFDKLWKENQVFREELKTISKFNRTISPLKKLYTAEQSQLKQEFKQIIFTSAEFIKDQRKKYKKLFMKLPTRSKFLSRSTRFNNMLNKILNTYDITQRQLHDGLQRTKGTPRIPYHTYQRWKYSHYRVLRVRLN